MIKPEILIDSIHTEVLDRTPGPTKVSLNIKLEAAEFSKDEKRLTLRYKFIKTTRFARTSIEGVLTLYAEDTDELKLLEKMARPEKEEIPPSLILEIIILKTQPLVLHIEDMLGVPPVPVTPPSPIEKLRKRKEEKQHLLYQ